MREVMTESISRPEVGTYAQPDMAHYVSALTRHLEIPSEARRALEEQGTTDPFEWAKKVRWAEGDKRVVKANISRISRGPITLSSDSPIPEKVDANTPVKDALGALAMYQAKLEYLEDNAPDFVTLPSFRLAREKGKVGRNIQELFSPNIEGGKLKTAKTKLGEVFSGAKKKAVITGVALATAACGNMSRTTEIVPPVEPTPTAFQPIIEATPTANPAETPTPNVIESSALSEAGLNVSVESVIPGYLSTAQGERFVLAQSTWHQPSGEDIGLSLLIAADGGGNIVSVNGLAYNEFSAATSYDMFYGFTFDTTINSVNMSQYELIRLHRETGRIEVFSQGGWQVLEGQDEIITQVGEVLRGRAAPVFTQPEVPVTNEWVVSSDGRIASNPTEMYGGVLEIVDEPERTAYLYDRIIRILWGLNHVTNNRTFLQTFPTEESFVNFAQGENPIVDLGIPVRHPGTSGQFRDQGTLEYLEGIDISTFAIGIANPSRQEMIEYSSGRTEFFTFHGNYAEILVRPIEVNGRTILSFTFRTDYLQEAEGFEDWVLAPDKSREDILTASTVLINVALRFFEGLVRQDSRDAWITETEPPILNVGAFTAQASPLEVMTWDQLGILPLDIRR